MDKDKSDFLFMGLISSLQYQCMIQLGKISDPATGKTGRFLEAAQATIDMLDMLKAKTEGNLSEDEQRMLNQIIADAKLNFVDESGRKDEGTKPEADSSIHAGDGAGNTDNKENEQENKQSEKPGS